MSDRLKGARLMAAAALGLLVFNYPFLALYDADTLVAGVSVVWLYLFVVWALFIALVAWIIRS